jgi:ribose 5-phosphate isomerase A
MDTRNELKRNAARRAVEFVKSGMVVGLGTGSTVEFALERIAELLNTGALQGIVGIPTSDRTAKRAQEMGIPLGTLDDFPEIDITIDGADEVDADLNLIKGGGGALLREKIVAQASRRNMIVVDDSKLSPALGTISPLPVEVIPFGLRPQVTYLESLGSRVTIRKNKNGERFITDQGNMILDCKFDRISNPSTLSINLGNRAGIVEHGLFVNLATDVIVSGEDGIRHRERQSNLGSE